MNREKKRQRERWTVKERMEKDGDGKRETERKIKIALGHLWDK